MLVDDPGDVHGILARLEDGAHLGAADEALVLALIHATNSPKSSGVSRANSLSISVAS